MKASQLNITIYKEGEDVDMGATKPFMKEVAELATERGFRVKIDLRTVEVETDGKEGE